MFAHWWHHPQITRLQARFTARPRHPLLRIGVALLGVALLAVLLVVGVFIGAAMLIGAGLLRLLRRKNTAPHTHAVIEGEFRKARPEALPQTQS
ncbi:hypothetical protein CO611_06475 [Lysobacteraceae bacterium NML03-0222]|nr:hypothetical protein CO611_06475 [Xanthomonadaceae bacterium NML03-0222]